MGKLTIAAIVALGLFAASAPNHSWAASTDQGTREEQMDVRFVVIHKPGPKWVQGVDFREQPGVMDHVLHYKKFDEQGRLELGGPFLDGTGGMMVPVAGETRESIEAYASEDPAVKNGLLTFEVKPWFIAMKRK